MPVQKVIPPAHSLLFRDGKRYDYSDSFSSALQDKEQKFTAADAAKAFFTYRPSWIMYLMKVRDSIVSLFGLETFNTSATPDKHDQLIRNTKFEPGDTIGLFKVYECTASELIMGKDDRHLNFRVSLLLSDAGKTARNLTITTVVRYNNWFGRLYFIPVRPFHTLIVPAMLKATIKALEHQH